MPSQSRENDPGATNRPTPIRRSPFKPSSHTPKLPSSHSPSATSTALDARTILLLTQLHYNYSAKGQAAAVQRAVPPPSSTAAPPVAPVLASSAQVEQRYQQWKRFWLSLEADTQRPRSSARRAHHRAHPVSATAAQDAAKIEQLLAFAHTTTAKAPIASSAADLRCPIAATLIPVAHGPEAAFCPAALSDLLREPRQVPVDGARVARAALHRPITAAAAPPPALRPVTSDCDDAGRCARLVAKATAAERSDGAGARGDSHRSQPTLPSTSGSHPVTVLLPSSFPSPSFPLRLLFHESAARARRCRSSLCCRRLRAVVFPPLLLLAAVCPRAAEVPVGVQPRAVGVVGVAPEARAHPHLLQLVPLAQLERG